ncbi:SDR family oxidoreductase, partial [Novosphingobium bradum]
LTERASPPMDLAGTCAIITGGGSGIGRASALSLARRGAAVIVADIAGNRAAETADLVEAAGGRARALAFDVAADPFEGLRDCALEAFGRIDVVMNNVGVLTNGRPEALPEEEWRRVIEINLMSVVRSNLVFLPHLIAQGSGHLVNTASFAGLFTYAFDRLPYAACKAAIVQISEGLALYLKPQGIGVTVLCPGPVMTDIAASSRSFGEPLPIHTPGPQFAPLGADVVGEQVAEAIVHNRFMVPTHEQVRDLLVARAANWDAFIDDRIANPSVITRPPSR